MSAKLKVLVTADPELPVPPRLYGGIERVIALLVDGLTERAHDVTLFAHPESRVACRLVAYPGLRSRSKIDTVRNAAALAAEVARATPDVVHSFSRLAYLLPILPSRIPKVMSYQRAVTPRTVARSARLAGGTITYVGCSRQLIAPVASTGHWRVIYNAVPVDRYKFSARVDENAPLVFLGRIEQIKGVHIAIEVARAAKRRLILAGNVPDSPESRRYFDEAIVPHVDGLDVQYEGPVDDARKSEILSSAAALLMPVLWDEPFGIVMAEALACGTPVLGLNRGAVPEVVRDGVTGFVCDDSAQIAIAVGRLHELDRTACRRDAESRFSAGALVDAYEALYREVAQPRLAGAPPRTRRPVEERP